LQAETTNLFFKEELINHRGENMSDNFSTFNLEKEIDSYKARRAITYAFNDDSAANDVATVLVYLVISFFKHLKNYILVSKFNGFMIKTPKDVEVATGIPQRVVSQIYGRLTDRGLIEKNNKSDQRRTCVKVNLEAVQNLLDEYVPKSEEYMDSYFNEQKAKREEIKKRFVKSDKTISIKINLEGVK